MPELPEVEHALRGLARNILGKTILRLHALHPSVRRTLGAAIRRRVTGKNVARVERRGKHQLLHLDGGSVLHVHFRMAGDWLVVVPGAALPRHARAVLEMDDGLRAVLTDPRALSTITLHARASDALPDLGAEADDPTLTGAALRTLLAPRRGAIKIALLDQRVIAGLGNIYAAEALWVARIDPRTPASTLSRVRCDRLLRSVRQVLARARQSPGRYASEASAGLAVYGREGQRCLRRDGSVRRIRQAGRSTYFCPRCQR